MRIETKFDVGENAVIIDNNIIITIPVYNISYINKTIRYEFMTSKALSMMDKDIIIHRDEKECFKSINELTQYYESKQNRKTNPDR
jgi:hypothetical protein